MFYQQQKGVTGLGRVAGRVGFSLVHGSVVRAQRLFHRKYRQTYRYPRWWFIVDLWLMAIAATCFGTFIFFTFFLQPFEQPQLLTNVQVGSMTAGNVVSLDVELRSDQRTREPRVVQLTLKAPAFVRVVGRPTQSVSLMYGEVQHVEFFFQLLAPMGSRVPLQVTVAESRWYGDVPISLWSAERRIEAQALRATLPLDLSFVLPHAHIPVHIQSTANTKTDLLSFRILSSPDSHGWLLSNGQSNASWKDVVAPFDRVVYLEAPSSTAASNPVHWELLSGPYVLQEGVWDWKTADFFQGLDVRISSSDPVGDLRVENHSSVTGTIFIAPSLQHATSSLAYDVVTVPSLASFSQTLTSTGSVTVIPFLQTSEGWIVGLSTIVEQEKTIGTAIEWRDRTASGDVVGAGPWPPRSEEKSLRWMVVRWSNVDQELRNGTVDIQLPRFVRSTGVTVLPSGMQWEMRDGELGLAFHDVVPQDGSVVAAFEMEIFPQKNDLVPAPLVQKISGWIEDVFGKRRSVILD